MGRGVDRRRARRDAGIGGIVTKAPGAAKHAPRGLKFTDRPLNPAVQAGFQAFDQVAGRMQPQRRGAGDAVVEHQHHGIIRRGFGQGPPDGTGWRFSDDLDAYGFVSAKPGSRVFVSNESEGRTYSGMVEANGSVTNLKPFADRGGESVAVGANGNVYLADGAISSNTPIRVAVG